MNTAGLQLTYVFVTGASSDEGRHQYTSRMPKNLNSATRLLRLLEQVHSHKDAKPSLDVWASILQVQETHPVRRAVAVGELVHAMHRELGLVALGLAAADFSAVLYEAALNRIEHAISPLQLSNSWASVKQFVTPDVMTALAFCTEILPDEEAAISGDELSTIREQVESLRSTLADNALPPRLQTLIRHHIDLIERALSEYQVVGAKALREAARTALGEMIEAKDEIKPAKDSDAVAALESTWKSVNSAADVALKGERLAQLGQKAWDALSGIF